MPAKPTYEELEAKIARLESELSKNKRSGLVRLLSEDFVHLADRIPCAIYQFDIESRTFTFFNKLFLSLLGTGKKVPRILCEENRNGCIHSEDRHRYEAAVQASLHRGKNRGEATYRMIDADGATRWMNDRWTVVRGAAGEPQAIDGVIQDITGVKQAEDEIKKVIRAAFIGCYLIQNGKFLYFNREFMRITGYSEKELPRIWPLDIVHEDHRSRTYKNAVQMLKGERNTPYEFCIVDKQGAMKWIIEAVTSVRHNQDRAVMGYFMDITQSKQAEEDRKEKEKLQAVLEMAGAVCHELNNPLQGVLVGSKMLAEKKLNPSVKAEVVRIVRENIDKMVSITKKFQKITHYATKDYVEGKKIFDLDAASK